MNTEVVKLENPSDLKYTKEHEWARVEGDVATCGITDFAQHALTDVVFVELPDVGKKVEQLKQAAIIESVKSVSDIYAPFSGEIVEVNEALNSNPEKVNNDPYGEGWMFKIKIANVDESANLMDASQYENMSKE